MRWLLVSVVLSVVLTVLLNVGLRAFPDAGHRLARNLAELTSPGSTAARAHDRRGRVLVPWRATIIGSLILTIVVNLVLWII